MTAHVVVEGAMDEALIRPILSAAGIGDARFYVANGKSAAVSTARSLLVSNRSPVAIVVDADSYDPRAVSEHESTYNYLLGMASSPERFRLFSAIPEIEAVLFSDPALLERITGVEMTDEDKTEAKYRPKHVLDRLIAKGVPGKTLPILLANFNNEDFQRLSKHPLMRSLVEFLRIPAASC